MLDVVLDSPTYTTARFGTVPVLDAVATYDDVTGSVTVFAVNRDTTQSMDLTVQLSNFGPLVVDEAWVLGGGDPHEINTADLPEQVHPRPLVTKLSKEGLLVASLPPVSWCVLSLVPASESP